MYLAVNVSGPRAKETHKEDFSAIEADVRKGGSMQGQQDIPTTCLRPVADWLWLVTAWGFAGLTLPESQGGPEGREHEAL